MLYASHQTVPPIKTRINIYNARAYGSERRRSLGENAKKNRPNFRLSLHARRRLYDGRRFITCLALASTKSCGYGRRRANELRISWAARGIVDALIRGSTRVFFRGRARGTLYSAAASCRKSTISLPLFLSRFVSFSFVSLSSPFLCLCGARALQFFCSSNFFPSLR